MQLNFELSVLEAVAAVILGDRRTVRHKAAGGGRARTKNKSKSESIRSETKSKTKDEPTARVQLEENLMSIRLIAR